MLINVPVAFLKDLVCDADGKCYKRPRFSIAQPSKMWLIAWYIQFVKEKVLRQELRKGQPPNQKCNGKCWHSNSQLIWFYSYNVLNVLLSKILNLLTLILRYITSRLDISWNRKINQNVDSKISNNVGFKFVFNFNTCQKVFNQFIIHIVFLILLSITGPFRHHFRTWNNIIYLWLKQKYCDAKTIQK